jgi:hypothetical protein
LPADIDGLFILLLLMAGWNLGKFSEHKPAGRKFKYTIIYDDCPSPTQLKLENYCNGDEVPTEPCAQ